MTTRRFLLHPIAIARSERIEIKDDWWGDVLTSISLADTHTLKGYSHANVIFQMHQVNLEKAVTGARHPRNNPTLPSLGIFAQRGKNRLNRLGLSCAEIYQIDHNRIIFRGLDVIDKTPILTIHPYTIENSCKKIREPQWLKEMMIDYFSGNIPEKQALTQRLKKIQSTPSLQDENIAVDSLASASGNRKKVVINLNAEKLSPDCTKGLIECFSHVYFIYLLPKENTINIATAKLMEIDAYRITVTDTLLPDGAEILDIKPYSTYFLPEAEKVFSPI